MEISVRGFVRTPETMGINRSHVYSEVYDLFTYTEEE